MSEILSAEKATKFLRSKENVGAIIDTAHQILDGELDIYLPQREIFILNLLVDRLNDRSNTKFGNWKHEPRVWELLVKVWHQCTEQQRNNSIKQLRILDTVCHVLDKGDSNTIESAMTGLDLVYRESYVETDENSACLLLKSYVQAASGEAKWDQLVQNIYNRVSLKSTREFSKKSYSKFFQECCPSILSYLTKPNASSIFQEILVREIFNKDAIEYLNSNIATLIKETLNDSSIELLYKLIVEQLSSKNMDICQQVYSTIITKYNHLSESLLSQLASSQKTLTHEFAESIYSNEVDSKSFTEINWNMVKYLFTLDNDLAVEKSSFIFENYTSSTQLEMFDVGKSIVQGYVNNRELTEFITTVWPRAIEFDPIWKSPQFVQFVSSTVDTFTSKQLVHVIEQCYKLDQSYQVPIFTALTTGLITCSFQMIESVKENFIGNFTTQTTDFWHIRFNLLCLYGKTYSISKDLMTPVQDKYYYFTLFRLLELGSIESINKVDQSAFLELLKGNPDLSSVIVNRWLVILNNFFDQQVLIQVLELVMKEVKVTQLNHAFFEQRKLTSGLLKLIITDLPVRMDMLQAIPIHCISRTSKKDLMNQLFDLLVKLKLASTLDIIKHLLSQPSYQSDLEVNFDNLIKLVGSKTSASFEIARMIWTSHVQQIKDNEEYVSSAIEFMVKYLEKKNKGKISGELELCLIILSSHFPEQLHAQFDNLKRKFITKCVSYLDKCTEDDSSLIWYLHALIAVKSEVSYSEIWAKLQKAITNDQSIEIKSILFQLICHTISIDFSHSIYVLSLFVALHSQGVTNLDLGLYITRLINTPEVYSQVFNYFVDSIEEFNDCYVIIACHFFTNVKRDDYSNESISKCMTLFIQAIRHNSTSIGLILETLKVSLVDHAWIFNQYLLEKTLVIIAHMAHTVDTPDLYILTTQVTSHILLYHRFKLSTRHHIILHIASELLRPFHSDSNSISKSIDSAAAYSRLLQNLCEPSQRSSVPDQSKLTTTANLFKSALRKHIVVLLVNYIYFNLKFHFLKNINDELVTGIYSIFDVLSSSELTLVNASLDNPGKSFYKTLYNDYKEYGKWKDQ
ncbi:Nucleolar pre-ribosomal-associated protein 2 [Spathaspora sp. JA1]|nr:Nucleolar pre-ribosomal-associated protein 2 [Spathaspora sp. JA1]